MNTTITKRNWWRYLSSDNTIPPCDMSRYKAAMSCIRARLEVVDYFMRPPRTLIHEKLNLEIHPYMLIECACLHFRKVLELIALASLVANRAAYLRTRNRLADEWNAGELLKHLANINPNSYPSPLEPIGNTYASLKTGFLSREEFPEVYGRCGEIAHAPNPYDDPIDYEFFIKALPGWKAKVVSLLRLHSVKLVDDNLLYIVEFAQTNDPFEVTMDAYRRAKDPVPASEPS